MAKSRGNVAELLIAIGTITKTDADSCTTLSPVLTSTSALIASTTAVLAQSVLIQGDTKRQTVKSVGSTSAFDINETGAIATGSGLACYARLENVVSNDCSMNQGEVEATDCDSNGWKEYLTELNDLSFSINVNYAQMVVQDRLLAIWLDNPTTTTFRIYFAFRKVAADAVITTYKTCMAKISSLSLGSPCNGVQTMSINLKPVGAVVAAGTVLANA